MRNLGSPPSDIGDFSRFYKFCLDPFDFLAPKDF
jgi:hypothetical protein